MIPGWSGTQRLVTRFGARAVRRLALAGEIVTAEVALAMGLVDEVVEKGGAMDRAMALAAQVRSRGPVANTIAKQLINAAEGEDAAATMEILAGALVSYTDDLREGVAGFREKRPPVFQGR
jgi:enoyl-CoA hydratase